MFSLFFKNAAGKVNVVVFTHRYQDHEKEERNFPLQARIPVLVAKCKQPIRDAYRDKKAEQHGKNHVGTDNRVFQNHDQNREDNDHNQELNPARIFSGDGAQVANRCGGSCDVESSGIPC